MSLPHTSSDECPNRGVDGYCKCAARTTSTLDGKWPSDTWFQRAYARQLKREAEWVEHKELRRKERNEA